MDTSSGNDRARIALLLDCYGKMLTDKQYTAMDLYFQEDFTLSEISEQTGITRQGVWDNIRRGEKQLIEMEDRLHHVDKFSEIKDGISAAYASAIELREYAKTKFFPADLIKQLDAMIETFKNIVD